MSDNLVNLINKLSHQIVTHELEREKNLHPKKKDERYFRKCMRRVRQKGCDVLLNNSCEPPPPDPCVTDYGANWSPFVLLTDYARELKQEKSKNYSEVLLNSLKILEEKQCDCVTEMLKTLLILKKPFVDSSVQHEISLSGLDFFKPSIDSYSLINEECFPDSLCKKSSYKKALLYEESWTKLFDSKFQTLGEFSKKNLLSQDKHSTDSIFSASSSVKKCQSQSNSLVFNDFFHDKRYKSEKNLLEVSSTYLNDNSLLDSFVDTPIAHKLPVISFSQKPTSPSEVLDDMKGKFQLVSEELQTKSISSESHSDEKENSKLKQSIIQLKRNSNCSHSFSILYEKSNTKSQESSLGSNDSLMLFKDKKKVLKETKESTVDPYVKNSKEVVLGLWEQEQTIIKEFWPDLAKNFPVLRMITLSEFVEDVKYLLTGISSPSFFYNSTLKCFNMKYGTCLEDVTPESLYYFSKEFLEIGNCFVKLSSWASAYGKTDFDTNSIITQTFWKSVFDYLEMHYTTVIEIPSTTTLMTLKSCSTNLHEMITTMAEVCGVGKEKKNLPKGGELLSYLLQVAEKLSKQCVANIIFGILQNCCSVYFMCLLQTWMFKGQLEKQGIEFFVGNQRVKAKVESRSYYNSFLIMNHRVPSFLQGFDERIFNCGKSIHFLKLFNAEDPFCQILDKGDYPNMYLCLSEEELQKLEKQFKDYGNQVVEQCGGSVSVKSLMEEEKEQKTFYLEFKKIQEQHLELAKLKKQADLKAKKELQNKLLNEQKMMIEAKKQKKKALEEIEKRKYEEETNKTEEKRSEMINEEKILIKSYYDELMKSLEKKMNISEMRKLNLKKILEAEKIEKIEEANIRILDMLNDNETTKDSDEEETLSVNLDVNSNSNSFSQGNSVTEIDSKNAATIAAENETKTEGIYYDENSNPNSLIPDDENSLVPDDGNTRNVNSERTVSVKHREKTESMRKTASHRTVAAEEAARNKFKVLKSEFMLTSNEEDNVNQNSAKAKTSLSDLEKNRKKVLETEYNILKLSADHILIKSVPSKTEITKENILNANFLKPNVEAPQEISNFERVNLERKVECTDLQNPPEKKNLDENLTKSESSISLSQSNDNLSEGNALRTEEPEILDFSASRGFATLLSSNYQNTLLRNSEIMDHKLTYQEMFQGVKNPESENLPCTNFMKFERFLKKSLLIPLKIQEKLANDALLKHLFKGENLLSHFKSLRGYYFLNDGEFGRSFTYNIFRSLSKCTEPQKFFERSNLSNIVNEALNYTIHSSEPNAHNLSFQIVKMPPFLNHSCHDVLAPFELSYKVEWPLNIILTERCLKKYKSVFQFLLKLKRISWTLNENFLFLNSYFKNKRLSGKILVGSSHYHQIQIFRHTMNQIMITLYDYIFSNGIQLPWILFQKDLESTENVDHLYQKHIKYVKDVLERCFLSKNSEDLLDYLHSLIELTLKYHYTVKTSVFVVVDGVYEHPKFTVLKTTFDEFCSVVKTFLKTLKEKIFTNQVLKSHNVLMEKFDLILS